MSSRSKPSTTTATESSQASTELPGDATVNRWKVYDRPTIGSPGAKWVHYEISPTMADDPDLVDAAFTDILNRIVKALEGLK